MKNFLLACVALALVPSLALAGGGTKANGVITVKSAGTDLPMGVIVDPPANLDPNTATADQFKAAGGKFVDPGVAATFSKLKNGSHKVVVFLVGAEGIGPISQKNYDLVKGANTINIVVTFDANGNGNFAP